MKKSILLVLFSAMSVLLLTSFSPVEKINLKKNKLCGPAFTFLYNNRQGFAITSLQVTDPYGNVIDYSPINITYGNSLDISGITIPGAAAGGTYDIRLRCSFGAYYPPRIARIEDQFGNVIACERFVEKTITCHIVFNATCATYYSINIVDTPC